MIAAWAFLSKRAIDQKIDKRLARQADYDARLADYKRRQMEKIVEDVKREVPEASGLSTKGIESILNNLARAEEGFGPIAAASVRRRAPAKVKGKT